MQRAYLKLPVHRHDASLPAAAQEYMAAALPDDDEPEPLQYANALGTGHARKLRHL